MNADAPPWESTGWTTRSALKNANKMGESGGPCARPAFTSSSVSVRKSSNPMLACRPLIKLAIHFLATIGIPLVCNEASRLTRFTPLKAPLRSNAINVTTLCLYQALSIALDLLRANLQGWDTPPYFSRFHVCGSFPELSFAGLV